MKIVKILAVSAVVATIAVSPALAKKHRAQHAPTAQQTFVASEIGGNIFTLLASPFSGTLTPNVDANIKYRNGYACEPGTWFKDAAGKRHPCR